MGHDSYIHYSYNIIIPVWVSPMTRIVAMTDIKSWLLIIFVQLTFFIFSVLLLLTIIIVDTNGEVFLSEVLTTVKLVEFSVNPCGCWLRSVDDTNQSCGMETPWLLIKGGTKFQALDVSFVVHVSWSCFPSHTWAKPRGDRLTKPNYSWHGSVGNGARGWPQGKHKPCRK